jgi:uncharacterized membrane protein (GlpM family)
MIMEDLFLFKLILAFAVGSTMVTFATVAAERLGSKMGGLIGGIPTAVAISLFFIGYTETPRLASEATSTVPLTMGLNGLFLVVYVGLAGWGAWVAMAGAFFLWFALVSLVILLNFSNFFFSLLFFILSFFGSYWTLEKCYHLPSTEKILIRYTPLQILSRALFSGGIISSAVYLSRVGGPVWGGIMAPFPTVYISTLIILAKSKGVEFSRRITKPLLVSSMINVVAYAIAVRYFYLLFDLALGTVLALGISAMSTYGIYWFMKNKMR